MPALKWLFGIDAALVVLERRQFGLGQELVFGDADAVFARDHAVEVARDMHDARDGFVGLLQHFVVVGIDRDIGVHIAVARVHVQRDEHPALEHAVVDRLCFGQDRRAMRRQ